MLHTVKEKTTVESITQVCEKHRLAPDKTIHSLLVSNDTYAVGSIGVVVLVCQQNNKQLELNIKDGEVEDDNTIVSILLQ